MGALRAWVLPVLVVGLTATGGTAAVVARSGAGPELPGGWRWESFQDVEVAEPGGWGHTASADMSGGCSGPVGPVVSRPGIVPLMSCTGSGRQVGQFVEFESGRSVSDARLGTVGDRTTVRAGSVVVIVQAPEELRERILSTLRTVEADAHGCAVFDPLAAESGLRPTPAVDVTRLTAIESVTACMYDIPEFDDPVPGAPPLFGSVQLRGADADHAVRAIAAAPVATGRQDSRRCNNFPYGFNVAALLVRSDQGLSRLHLRFSGCRQNGIDDGATVRELTPDNTHPFVSGAAHPPFFSGGPAGKTEASRGH